MLGTTGALQYLITSKRSAIRAPEMSWKFILRDLELKSRISLPPLTTDNMSNLEIYILSIRNLYQKVTVFLETNLENFKKRDFWDKNETNLTRLVKVSVQLNFNYGLTPHLDKPLASFVVACITAGKLE